MWGYTGCHALSRDLEDSISQAYSQYLVKTEVPTGIALPEFAGIEQAYPRAFSHQRRRSYTVARLRDRRPRRPPATESRVVVRLKSNYKPPPIHERIYEGQRPSRPHRHPVHVECSVKTHVRTGQRQLRNHHCSARRMLLRRYRNGDRIEGRGARRAH